MRRRLAIPITAAVLSLAALSLPVCANVPDENAFDAVLVEERMEIDIRSLTDVRVSYLNRTKIRTRQGAEDHAWADVLYSPGVEVRKLTGGIRTPEGKWVGIRRRDIHDAAAFASFELYSENRRRTISFPGARPGSTVEYEYELQVTNLQRLENVFWLQEEIPVRKKSLILRTPADFPLRISVRGKPEYSEKVDGGTLVRTWSVSDVPAIGQEPDSPPLDDLLPRVTLEPLKIVWGDREIDSSDWNGIAAFYLDLARSRMEPTPDVTAKALEIAGGAADRQEKIRRIFDFVRTSVNYVAITLGIGGYQPHASGDVLGHLYGDCKDKATLTIAMLHAVGIEALPVLILTRDVGTLERDHPMLLFNHVIVALAGKDSYVFMDPTAETVPFGDLPWSDQGASALVVLPGGRGEFIETPLGGPSKNVRKITFEGDVEPNGGLTGDLEVEVHGERRDLLYWLAKDQERKLEDRLVTLLSRIVPGATVEAPRIEIPEKEENPVLVKAHIAFPRYLSRTGSLVILPLTPIRLSTLTNVASRSKRTLPVFFDALFSDKIVSRTRLPGGLKVEDLPQDASASGPDLEATARYAVEQDGADEILVTRRTISVGRRMYSPEDYPALRDFVTALQAEDARAVTLRPGS